MRPVPGAISVFNAFERPLLAADVASMVPVDRPPIRVPNSASLRTLGPLAATLISSGTGAAAQCHTGVAV